MGTGIPSPPGNPGWTLPARQTAEASIPTGLSAPLTRLVRSGRLLRDGICKELLHDPPNRPSLALQDQWNERQQFLDLEKTMLCGQKQLLPLRKNRAQQEGRPSFRNRPGLQAHTQCQPFTPKPLPLTAALGVLTPQLACGRPPPAVPGCWVGSGEAWQGPG